MYPEGGTSGEVYPGGASEGCIEGSASIWVVNRCNAQKYELPPQKYAPPKYVPEDRRAVRTLLECILVIVKTLLLK